MPDTLTTIGNDVFTLTAFKKFTIPGSVTSVGESLLADVKTLTEITFGKGLTEIPISVVAGTSVTTVVIPEGYTSIGDDAFRSCNELTKVILPKTLTKIGFSSFISCPKLDF